MFLSIFNILCAILSIFIEFAHMISWISVGVLFLFNSCLLYVLSTKNKLKENFVFEVESKWLKPNTLFIPFEFNMCLCNYFILKIGVLGHGFDVRVKWRDVVKQTIEETIKTNLPQTEKIKII